MKILRKFWNSIKEWWSKRKFVKPKDVYLESFVKSVLVGICKSVVDSQKELDLLNINASVNPLFPKETKDGRVCVPERVSGYPDTKYINISVIKFDIAIEAKSLTDLESVVCVKSGVINGKQSGKSQTEEKSVSKISFEIPLEIPTTYLKNIDF